MKSFFMTLRLSWAVGIALVICFMNSGGVHAAGTNCGRWTVVPSPGGSLASSLLSGIAASSQSNVWAVGYTSDNNAITHTLIEHWNGSSWRVISSPNVGVHGNMLTAVAVVSPNNVWAVGIFVTFPQPEVGIEQPLIEHWNGSSWKVVSSPNPGSSDATLTGITAISANNIWAVGYGGGKTLIEHWNGKIWSIVSSPNLGMNDFLYGVTATSATDVWAVGDTPGGVRSGSVTLTEHWNGKIWSIVSSPNVGTLGSYLKGVSAIATNNVWSVGYYDQNYGSPAPTLIEHWNGRSWNVVSSPSPASGGNILESVAAISSSNVWAVGAAYNSGGVEQPLIEHWNGRSWNVVSSPTVGTAYNVLSSVSASVANNVWTAGTTDNTHTLTETYC